MTDINKEIGERLARRLAIAGKSQVDLAVYMNTSQASVSNWVNGVKIPRMDKIDKICEFLKCNRSDLLLETHNPAETMKDQEKRLLYYYSLLSEANKEKVDDIVKAFLVAQNNGE